MRSADFSLNAGKKKRLRAPARDEARGLRVEPRQTQQVASCKSILTLIPQEVTIRDTTSRSRPTDTREGPGTLPIQQAVDHPHNLLLALREISRPEAKEDWPHVSMTALAKRIGKCRETVRRWLGHLADDGLVALREVWTDSIGRVWHGGNTSEHCGTSFRITDLGWALNVRTYAPVSWADLLEIPSFPGCYATRSGDIFCQVLRGNLRRVERRVPSTQNKGYCRVIVNGRHQFAHVLVLLAYSGPKPDGMETRHINGVRTDNRIENLKWGTPLENNHDKRLHGSGNHLRRLTYEQALEIRLRVGRGEKQASLAREYGVNHDVIGKIVHLKTYRQPWAVK